MIDNWIREEKYIAELKEQVASLTAENETLRKLLQELESKENANAK